MSTSTLSLRQVVIPRPTIATDAALVIVLILFTLFLIYYLGQAGPH